MKKDKYKNMESIRELFPDRGGKIFRNNKGEKQRNFTQISNDLIDDQSLTNYEKMVFIAIKRHMIGKNTCWPSIDTISKKAGCGQTSTKEAIKSLVKKNYITKVKNNKIRSNTYKIVNRKDGRHTTIS